MTRDELAAILTAWGWSARQLAAAMGYSEFKVRHWCSGRMSIPDADAAAIRRRARYLAKAPSLRHSQTQGLPTC